MRLSPNFTFAELTATSVRGVNNIPSLEEAENLEFLAKRVLEPIRAVFGALYTTSGYRSSDVNRIIGGSPNSMHTKGCAWDGIPLRLHVKWSAVVEFCMLSKDLPIDQVIYEYGRWLHIGTRPGGLNCRRQALMIFEPGKYEPWDSKDKRVRR